VEQTLLSPGPPLTSAKLLPTFIVTVNKTVKDEIIEHVERLDTPPQRKVLDFARRLAASAGTPSRTLSRFQGCIDSEDLQAMSRVIQEGCEKTDSDGW
jgi:hypothetical protein